MIEHTTQWVLDNSPDPLDPNEIDWTQRQAHALIPFDVVGGRPLVPCTCPGETLCPRGRTGPGAAHRGRNDMRLWGENPMADALVTATCGGVRYVLLIERGDGAGWAMPGGAIEQWESPDWAAVRELREETGLSLEAARFVYDEPRWVPDPRGSMEAWAVTVVARCDLGEVDALPEVRGGDDARRASWIMIDSLNDTVLEMTIFPAHREILGALR